MDGWNMWSPTLSPDHPSDEDFTVRKDLASGDVEVHLDQFRDLGFESVRALLN
jgi:hypothetical protein